MLAKCASHCAGCVKWSKLSVPVEKIFVFSYASDLNEHYSHLAKAS